MEGRLASTHTDRKGVTMTDFRRDACDDDGHYPMHRLYARALCFGLRMDAPDSLRTSRIRPLFRGG